MRREVASRTRRPYLQRVMQAAQPLRLLQVRTTAVAAETLDALLGQWGALGTAIERRRGARLVRLQAYFPFESAVPVEWVHEKLDELHGYGVPIGPAEVRVLALPPEDWAESWKRHFKSFQATSRLWVVPSWETPPDEAIETMRIDPGMAFGQGDHPTTRGCLEMMERLEGAGASGPVADVGTGTGILAIRAVQLGLGPVEAFDTEEDAIRAARENAARNGAAGSIRFSLGSLPARSAGPYQLILANIFLSILIRLLPRFVRALPAGGEMIAAGILGEQEDRLREEAIQRGFDVVDRICDPSQPGGRRWPVLRLRKGAGAAA